MMPAVYRGNKMSNLMLRFHTTGVQKGFLISCSSEQKLISESVTESIEK